MKIQTALAFAAAAMLGACSPGEKAATEAKTGPAAAAPAAAAATSHPDDDAAAPKADDHPHDADGAHPHDGEDADHKH